MSTSLQLAQTVLGGGALLPLKTALLGSSPGLNTGNEKRQFGDHALSGITAPSFQTHQFQLRTELGFLTCCHSLSLQTLLL